MSNLGWHIDIKRLIQLLKSFDTIREVKFYHGTLKGKEQSEYMITHAQELGYIVKTKPVKIMKISIDVSAVDTNSPEVLKNLIRQPLLAKLKVETIEALNNELKLLNQQGIMHVEERSLSAIKRRWIHCLTIAKGAPLRKPPSPRKIDFLWSL